MTVIKNQNLNFENSLECKIPHVSIKDLNNPILNEVQELLLNQTIKGLDKYGTTVNPDDYSVIEWIDHSLQEKVDDIVYLVTLKHKLRKMLG